MAADIEAVIAALRVALDEAQKSEEAFCKVYLRQSLDRSCCRGPGWAAGAI